MAQIIWVTGCTFSYSDATSQGGDTALLKLRSAEQRATPLRSTSIPDKGRTYHLLWSSVGQGAAEKLAAETAARRQQFAAEQQTQRDAQRERTTNLLQEERAGLALSEADAIARYRGVNDALLLNLLDPARRAGLGLLTSLSEDDTNTLLNGQGRMPMLSREWSAWSPDQQAALKQALGLDQLPKEGQVSVVVGAGRGGMLMAMVQTDEGPQVLGRARGLLASGGLRPRQEAQLRGYLGEPEPSQPAAGGGGQPAAGGGQAPAQQGPANRQQQRAQQREQWMQAREEAMAQARALSPEAEQLLAGVTLAGADAGGSLWQVQEAVAKATGLDVVSDCFSPPRPGFRPRGQQAPETVAALDALSQAGGAFGPGFGGGFRGFGGGPPGPGGGGGGTAVGGCGSVLEIPRAAPRYLAGRDAAV
jgi:hypothetical protein